MSWAKLDDRFHGNRKVRRAWKRNRASVGLYVLALTYAAQHETDGMVDAEFIEDAMPVARERDAAVTTLIDTELWERDGESYRIHDYLKYQHSAADAAKKRDTKAKRQAAWRERNASTDTSRSASTDASTPRHVDGPVDSAPTRPDPTTTRPDPTEPPLAPPSKLRGEQGSPAPSLRRNSRALGTAPRDEDERHLAAVAAERSSLAIASFGTPDDSHREQWERLHTASHQAVGDSELLNGYVGSLKLAAVEGDVLVIDGPDDAHGWALARFRGPLAQWSEALGVRARIATLDEHNGLRGGLYGSEAA